MTTPERLFIIVATQNQEVIQEMVFMYGINAMKKGWMDEVRIIFWGPSQKKLLISPILQERLEEFKSVKGEPWACKRCAEELRTLEGLSKLGVKTEYVGELLTQMLKSGWYQLTF